MTLRAVINAYLFSTVFNIAVEIARHKSSRVF